MFNEGKYNWYDCISHYHYHFSGGLVHKYQYVRTYIRMYIVDRSVVARFWFKSPTLSGRDGLKQENSKPSAGIPKPRAILQWNNNLNSFKNNGPCFPIKTTSVKHNASQTISVVSGYIYLFMHCLPPLLIIRCEKTSLSLLSVIKCITNNNYKSITMPW